MRLVLITLFLFSWLQAESGILDIQWPKPNPKHQKPAIPYPDILTKNIENTKLPVYIPSSYAYDENMSVIGTENFYTITFPLDKAKVMITGDKTYQESVPASNPEFKAMMKATPPVEFIRAEGLMMAEFNRHGVNYVMTIECDKPDSDERCTQTSLISNLYTRLIMVGGRP